MSVSIADMLLFGKTEDQIHTYGIVDANDFQNF